MAKHIQLDYTNDPKLRYPKMYTLYKRDEKGKIIEGDFSKKEFKAIKIWHVAEKVDGTNVRIFFNKLEFESPIEIRGRNNNSDMPAPLYNYLERYFTSELMYNVFDTDKEIVLCGEGYGPGIQKGGGLYRDSPGFILFDVKIGNWWLEWDKVQEIAKQLGIDHVPAIGLLDLESIIALVKSKRSSYIAKNKDKIMEGIVATSIPLLLFRNGNPLKFKLKVRDFESEKSL
jgi:hypothetical protein